MLMRMFYLMILYVFFYDISYYIISICAYLLVSTCAYITQLLFAGVATCYTKNLSSSDWMRVMFHPMAEPAQRKWEILKNQRCFPPKKNTDEGGGKPGTTKQKNSTMSTHPPKTEFGCERNGPKKNTGEKSPRFDSWKIISSFGHRTCKSCSKGFSTKGSSSSSWRSEESG